MPHTAHRLLTGGFFIHKYTQYSVNLSTATSTSSIRSYFFSCTIVLLLLSFYYRFNCSHALLCIQTYTHITHTVYCQMVQVHCRRFQFQINPVAIKQQLEYAKYKCGIATYIKHCYGILKMDEGFLSHRFPKSIFKWQTFLLTSDCTKKNCERVMMTHPICPMRTNLRLNWTIELHGRYACSLFI